MLLPGHQRAVRAMQTRLPPEYGGNESSQEGGARPAVSARRLPAQQAQLHEERGRICGGGAKDTVRAAQVRVFRILARDSQGGEGRQQTTQPGRQAGCSDRHAQTDPARKSVALLPGGQRGKHRTGDGNSQPVVSGRNELCLKGKQKKTKQNKKQSGYYQDNLESIYSRCVIYSHYSIPGAALFNEAGLATIF